MTGGGWRTTPRRMERSWSPAVALESLDQLTLVTYEELVA